jgi:hypothetical protein
MRSEDQVRAVDQRPNDPKEMDPIYKVFAAPVTVNWGPPKARGGRCQVVMRTITNGQTIGRWPVGRP